MCPRDTPVIGPPRRPVARARDKDGVQVVLVDQAIEVRVSEALAGTGAPVAKEARLRVLQFQGLLSNGLSFR